MINDVLMASAAAEVCAEGAPGGKRRSEKPFTGSSQW